jgi:4-diphosphocytidyl-2-C-methyl-D-erythritol kinase
MSESVCLKSHGKVNLFLGITGPREDGFHNLVSIVSQLELHDSIHVQIDSDESGCFITTNRKDVPADETNLVYRAYQQFCNKTELSFGLKVMLDKVIPPGSGLGAGSSNAMAVLNYLNDTYGNLLNQEQLVGMGSELGSDVPLFVNKSPKIMRGRGEILEEIDSSLCNQLNGRKIVLFRPEFGISTPWAFSWLKEHKEHYLNSDVAENRMKEWIQGRFEWNSILYNNMEYAAISKYMPIRLILKKMRDELNFKALMSGSGSTCFCFYETEEEFSQIREQIVKYFGENAWVEKTQLIVS